MNKQLDYDVVRDGVTQSLLTTWRTCPTRARMSIKGYYQAGSSASLIYGIIFHECMDFILNDIKNGVIQFHEEVDKDYTKKIIAKVSNRLEAEFNAADANMKEQWVTSSLIMLTLIPEYFKFWADDFKMKTIEVEKVFDVDFEGVKLRGKIDWIYEKNGLMWLSDHKTKSVVKEDAIVCTIGRDLQVNKYMLAYYLETGVKLAGVMYNVIRKSSLRKKSTEDMKQFSFRIREDIVKRPEFYFLRYEAKINWNHIDVFKKRLSKELMNFKVWVNTNEELDAQYTHNCTTVYGSCPFLLYCDSNGEDTSGLLLKEKHFTEL